MCFSPSKSNPLLARQYLQFGYIDTHTVITTFIATRISLPSNVLSPSTSSFLPTRSLKTAQDFLHLTDRFMCAFVVACCIIVRELDLVSSVRLRYLVNDGIRLRHSHFTLCHDNRLHLNCLFCPWKVKRLE